MLRNNAGSLPPAVASVAQALENLRLKPRGRPSGAGVDGLSQAPPRDWQRRHGPTAVAGGFKGALKGVLVPTMNWHWQRTRNPASLWRGIRPRRRASDGDGWPVAGSGYSGGAGVTARGPPALDRWPRSCGLMARPSQTPKQAGPCRASGLQDHLLNPPIAGGCWSARERVTVVGSCRGVCHDEVTGVLRSVLCTVMFCFQALRGAGGSGANQGKSFMGSVFGLPSWCGQISRFTQGLPPAGDPSTFRSGGGIGPRGAWNPQPHGHGSSSLGVGGAVFSGRKMKKRRFVVAGLGICTAVRRYREERRGPQSETKAQKSECSVHQQRSPSWSRSY